MGYTQDDHGSVELNMHNGIDGLNNIADIEDGYVIDAKNVDLSSPGFVQKRAGYHLYGCKLPVRVKSLTLVNGGGAEYTNVAMQFDFVPQYERTIQIWRNDNNANSAYGDARFFQEDDQEETAFVRIKDYSTNPNTNTITTSTVLEIQHGGNEYYTTPIAIFDNNTFIIPLQPLLAAGISPNLGAGAATEKTTRFGSGPVFKSLTKSDISFINVNPDLVTVAVQLTSTDTPDIRLYAMVRFDAGLTSNSATSRTGYVSNIIGNNLEITLYAPYPIDGLRDNYFPRIFYCNGYAAYFKSQTAEFLASDLPSASNKIIQSCNNLVLSADNLIIKSTPTGIYTDIGFLYGTEIDAPQVNMLAYFYDISELKNRMVVGYSGNIFVETDPPDRVYNTTTTAVLASQIISINASGFVNITVPSSAVYATGDTVYLEQSADTGWGVVTYTFTVTAKPTGASLTLYNLDYASTSINVKSNAKLRFSRTSTTIGFRTESYDSIPRIFPGATFQLSVGTSYATHRIATVNYFGTTSNTLTVPSAITWESDSTIKFGSIFTPANYPDSSSLDNYEPILSAYLPNAAVDLSHALIDRNIFIAAQKNGIWKYNGSELINQYLPMPPPPLATNVPSSAGNLKIVEDSDGIKIGRFYNLVITYSYFEFVNGILTEIESGATSRNTVIVQAAPAIDGSFNSQLIEVQVKTVPRGIGLPADNLFINVYRTTDGTSDGILDGQAFYRESSKLNDPDTPYVTIYVGTLTSSLLEDNGKLLYASVSLAETDEEARNKRRPPLANHVVNFQNRLVAFNTRETPYFNFVANAVYDPTSLTSDFGASGLLNFIPADSALQEYRFCMCPCDDTTVSNSVASPSGSFGVTYKIFNMESRTISAATYADDSNLLGMDLTATYGAKIGVNDRLVLRSVNRDNYKTEYDNYFIDGQVFSIDAAPAGTLAKLTAQKKWSVRSLVGVALSNNYVPFKFYEGTTEASQPEVVILKSSINLINTASLAGSLNGLMLVIRGLGTLAQMRDNNDSDNRVYDMDTEIIFLATGAGSDYALVPYKILGYSPNADQALVTALDWDIDVEVVGKSLSSALDAVFHGSIEIFANPIAYAATTFEYLSVTPTDTPEQQITLTVSSSAGLTPNVDYISIDGVPKLPNESGIEVAGSHLVSSIPGATSVKIYIEPPDNIFPDFSSVPVSGKFSTSAYISFASTYMEILYPSGLQTIVASVAIEQNQWVFVIAKTADTLQHSLQVSGWYQVYQVSTAAGVWGTAAAAGNLFGLRLKMNGAAVDPSILVGLTNLKVLVARSGTVTGGTIRDIPIPVPATPTGDITGTMFGPLDGQTPYERIIKRLGTAISTVFATEGFAYWGADPGNIRKEFPVNGLKFVNHQWPNNKYSSARDTSIGFYDENKYSLEMDLADGYYEWDADGGKTTSNGTLQTDDYLEERYPSRMWYTPPGSTDFRDISLYDLTNDDGEEIIGAIPFEEFMLVFKESQIFKVKIETTGPILDPVQAKVGAVSKKNIVAADSGAMFLAKSGFFFTDGNSCKKIIRLNRIFRDYIKKNEALFPFMAGGYDPTNYIIRLGAPVADNIDGNYLSFDRHLQLNFNMKEVESGVAGGGWSINTNMPANIWLHYDESSYFGSTTGAVYRIRSEYGATRYRDDESAIEYKVDTRYYDFGAPDFYKDVRETVIQLDTKYDNSMTISSAWNFRQSYTQIGSFTLDVSTLSSDEIGDRYTASQKYIESRRQTVVPSHSIQLSFRLSNSEIDQGAGVHGFWAHVNKIGPKVIRQQ